jgi:hypothetical protein
MSPPPPRGGGGGHCMVSHTGSLSVSGAHCIVLVMQWLNHQTSRCLKYIGKGCTTRPNEDGQPPHAVVV